MRLGNRISYRGSSMVVVVLPDGRERSVPRAATDLAEAPIPRSLIHPLAPISVRSLLPLANRIRIMLLCEEEDHGGAALPGRLPTYPARSGADLGIGPDAKAMEQSSGSDKAAARPANGASNSAPPTDAEPCGGA
ncbi:hypothetical protein [Acidiphilium sp.]|uniref:hypothetical protein n=1 Tax=Acidiphilium sp. TaxID=527 RepID=UPI00338FB2A8